MLIGMRTEVMTFFLQFPDDGMKGLIPAKITGEKEGCFDIGIVQCFFNKGSAFCKLMTGKDKGDFLLGTIASDDGSFILSMAS
jgi:hypothetical protein